MQTGKALFIAIITVFALIIGASTAMAGNNDFVSDLDLTKEQIDICRGTYYGMVWLVDTQVGRLLNVLEKAGILDDIVGYVAHQYCIHGVTVLILDQPRE